MILDCQNICKSFGTDVILNNISFHLEEKEKMAEMGHHSGDCGGFCRTADDIFKGNAVRGIYRRSGGNGRFGNLLQF